MAENEYLDSSKARRWQSVVEGVRDGLDLDELARRVLDRFYKTLANIRKDLPFAELVDALNDYPTLSRLCDEIQGASDVKDFLLQAALQNDEPAEILERFLTDALNNCLYDIPHLAAEHSSELNLSDARRKMDAARSQLAPELRRIATKLSENPSCKLRRKGASKATNSRTDGTKAMLSESLIAGFRK